MVTNIQDYAVS